jgi:hypothetical protein
MGAFISASFDIGTWNNGLIWMMGFILGTALFTITENIAADKFIKP